MSDVNVIDHIELRLGTLSLNTPLPDPMPIIVPGNPTYTYMPAIGAQPKDGDGNDASTQFATRWDITDPKGNHYGFSSSEWSYNFFPIYLVGTFHVSLTVTDSTGATKEFINTFDTVTQYDSGGGVMRDIPIDAAGNVKPIFEWIPNREGGYYNNGMAVFQTGTPTPYSSDYQCDILTKICRKKYLGTPPGAIDRFPVIPGTSLDHIPDNNHILSGRITQPLRRIPAGLLAHKQGTQQSTCWCWAIKPKLGDWEGYTSLNRNIDLPEYVDHMGNVVPAMTYLCAAGISPTSMPVRTSLVKDGIDVTVLAFDRSKLESKYYVGAEFEYFEINYKGPLSERWVAQAGFLGNTKISDSQATVEMVPWADLLNRPQGNTVGVLCNVGVMHNEEFGTGRCRNQIMQDGVNKDDWTVEMTVQRWHILGVKNAIGISQNNPIFNPIPGTSITGVAISEADFSSHLAGGRIEFTSGANQGITKSISTTSNYVGHIDKLYFDSDLPSMPAIGDTYHLTTGCRRTMEDCIFYNNVKNFRGFPYVPGQEGVIRRYRED